MTTGLEMTGFSSLAGSQTVLTIAKASFLTSVVAAAVPLVSEAESIKLVRIMIWLVELIG